VRLRGLGAAGAAKDEVRAHRPGASPDGKHVAVNSCRFFHISTDLICRKEEVVLMAPTGAAADNISGNTFHTALGISIAKTQKTAVSSRVRKLCPGRR
jgi:hypothetical protein